jgi:hypothetical protein
MVLLCTYTFTVQIIFHIYLQYYNIYLTMFPQDRVVDPRMPALWVPPLGRQWGDGELCHHCAHGHASGRCPRC